MVVRQRRLEEAPSPTSHCTARYQPAYLLRAPYGISGTDAAYAASRRPGPVIARSDSAAQGVPRAGTNWLLPTRLLCGARYCPIMRY
eukprot:2492820-Rhodomonas_salina.2